MTVRLDPLHAVRWRGRQRKVQDPDRLFDAAPMADRHDPAIGQIDTADSYLDSEDLGS